MRIVRGSGARRLVVIDLPCSEIVKRSPENEQRFVSGLLCEILGINHKAELAEAA